MKLLILGGTSDAIRLCELALQQHEVIYSIKGLVRQPKLNCRVHSGGFGGGQGLVDFLKQQKIDAILDATHPYAIKISQQASLAAKSCHIHCFHYIRPIWQQQPDDNWILFNNMTQLAQQLATNQNSLRLFFTLGRLCPDFIAKKKHQHHYIARSATENKSDSIIWIKSRGPFGLEMERKLFKQYKINTLVTKNSGGNSVAAKIQVAREMKLPVYMLQRPDFQPHYPSFSTIKAMLPALTNIL